MTDPFLTQPLDKGARVALDVLPASQEGASDLRTAYDGPCDVVQLAVPAGEGVAVEHFLERVFGIGASA